MSILAGKAGAPGWRVECPQASPPIDCTYTVEPSLTVKGGDPARWVANAAPLKQAPNAEAGCPGASATFSVTYTVDQFPVYNLVPFHVSEAESKTVLCKTAEVPCPAGKQFPKDRYIDGHSSAWTHVALTSDGENLRLYVEGRLAATAKAIAAGRQPGDRPQPDRQRLLRRRDRRGPSLRPSAQRSRHPGRSDRSVAEVGRLSDEGPGPESI